MTSIRRYIFILFVSAFSWGSELPVDPAVPLTPPSTINLDCRVRVGGLPFALPTELLQSLRTDNLYAPVVSQSRVPHWVRAHMSGGKRLRPMMVYLAALAQGRDPVTVQQLAGFVELIHLGSLALDDIIDKAQERRGRPPLYIAEGEVGGLITGPWLQAYVFSKMVDVTSPAVIKLLAEVLMKMGDGEILQKQLKNRAPRGTYTMTEYNDVALGKTGHLFGLSLAIGALHHGDPENIVALWMQLGQEIGVAYQIKDDFEDAMAETGEINYAHLLVALRFGHLPFVAMDPDQFKVVEKAHRQISVQRNARLQGLIDALQNASPKTDNPSQNAAFETLREIVDYVAPKDLP